MNDCLMKISMNNVVPALKDMPCGNWKNLGFNAAVFPEILHQLDKGLLEKFVKFTMHLVEMKCKREGVENTRLFTELDRRIQHFNLCQSDKSVPRSRFKKGVSNLTKIGSQEYPSLVFQLCIAIGDKYVFLPRIPTLTSRYQKCGTLLLTLWSAVRKEEYTEVSLRALDDLIEETLSSFKECFKDLVIRDSNVTVDDGRVIKKEHWCTWPKFELTKHYSLLIRANGNALHNFGGLFESSHKLPKKANKSSSGREEGMEINVMNRLETYNAVDRLYQRFVEDNEQWEDNIRVYGDFDGAPLNRWRMIFNVVIAGSKYLLFKDGQGRYADKLPALVPQKTHNAFKAMMGNDVYNSYTTADGALLCRTECLYQRWYDLVLLKDIVGTAFVHKSFEAEDCNNHCDTFWLIEIKDNIPF